MKGPRSRTRHDVHRLWECPVCGRRRISAVQVCHTACACLDPAAPDRKVWMRLLEAKKTNRGPDHVHDAAAPPA
jgi:hypothetical protein